MARVITITSGKGGVGKTSISLNLSLSLASQGYRVCLFDADLGLANVNILTGIYPEKDLVDVILGQTTLDDIMIRDFQGVDIIPGSSGVEKLADLTQEETGRMIKAFLDLEEYDYFIFDTSAGISAQVISFCMASHEIVLVATCEPTSMTDAYSMLKTLSKNGYNNPVKILINQVKRAGSAKQVYSQLKDTVKRFLNIKIEPLGIIGWDKSVRMAVISQTPFLMLFPDSLASKCIHKITGKLIENSSSAAQMPLEIFWDKCFAFFEGVRDQEQQTQKPETPAQKEPGSLGTGTSETPAAETDPAVLETISRIDSKLKTLEEQISQIRHILEGQTAPPVVEAPVTETEKLPEPVKITLDFESWLLENKKAFS